MSSDNWLASVAGDDVLPDVHLGRLAAQSPEEAGQMVAKVDRVRATATAHGAGSLLLVADDDEPDFAQLSDSLASLCTFAGRSMPQPILPAIRPTTS